MICRDMNDADRCRAGMRASVLTVCTPVGIHNVTLWSSCGTTASPTLSNDPLKSHGSFYACLIALHRLPLLATSPTASCCAPWSVLVLFLCGGAVNCTLATFC